MIYIPQAPEPPALPPSMLIGVPSIDMEHHALVLLLNRLLDSPETLFGGDVFFDALSHLGVDISTHFRNEEGLFKSCGMPEHEVDAHVQAHTEILEQNAELNFALMNGELIDRAEVLAMIKGWVVEHIVLHDLLIRKYVLPQ